MKLFFAFILGIILLGCSNSNNNNTPLKTDSPESGSINISVDESYKSVIDEQIKVYLSTYPKAKINVSYKPEVACFKDLQSDSTRLIIASRGLVANEIEYYKNKLDFNPQFAIVAYDAVAAIVNANNADTVFSHNDIKNILSGKKNYTVVLDGVNATSTVRYLQDSVLQGQPFGKNVVAVSGTDSVIAVIKKTKNAIGFVSNTYVSNTNEEQQLNNLKQIRLALIECVACPEKGYYAKASQATLMYGQYPLARPLYFIVKENWLGLGTGFTNFLSLERGQLIFRRSCLVPAKMNFNKRQTKL